MRNGIFIIGIVFAATLAYVVGNRLSNEAMAVVVGALCGISASIPVSIALFIAASKNWGRTEQLGEEPSDYAARPYAPQPPFIVVAPPQFSQPHYPQALSSYFPTSMPSNTIEARDFKIIGEE